MGSIDIPHPASAIQPFKAEAMLGVSLLTSVMFLVFGPRWLADLSNPLWLATVFVWLFAVILGAALAVVRHADLLALRLGEPYGTLVLTLSAISIEVMVIAAMMLHGDNNPTAARDTMFAVVMIVLNGMVGLALLLGGLRHREQHYNLQGANAYLGLIMPLAVLGLLFPNYTVSTEGPTLSTLQQLFLVFACLGLYGAFLALQTTRHRAYFMADQEAEEEERHQPRSPWFHGAMLVGYLIPVVLLAEKLAMPIDYGIEQLNLPKALGGVIVATLVAAPEALGAIRAAVANQLQRSMNIFLGSVLATIGLTVPAILLISLITGKQIILGLQNAEQLLLPLTLALSVLTFASGRTNVFQGAVHLVLFCCYLLLIFEA